MATCLSGDGAQDEDAVLDARKKDTRRLASTRRKSYHMENGAAAAENLVDRVLEILNPTMGSIVSGFLPIGSEIDLHPLMRALSNRGCRVVLPCVVKAGVPLVFRYWREGDPLVTESFGTRAPDPNAEAADPDILLVPMLAFDRRGYRLGYGGGFYDRSLAALRSRKPVTAAGVAYAGQEIQEVPIGPFDQPLDWVITDREAFRPCD